MRVEKTISEILPEKFIVIFNGWTTSDNHYATCYASDYEKNENGYPNALVGFSPIDLEISKNASHHYEFVKFVVNVDGKRLQQCEYFYWR